jgi:hypothetical protein
MSQAEAPELSPHLAQQFVEKWSGATSEKSDGQSFWRDFFIEVCGIGHLKEAGIEFERPVISSKKGNTNYIDVFWKDFLLIEHKSLGKNLDEAENQARGYILSLPPALRPPVIIVSDFARIRIVEYLLNQSHEFSLNELPKNLHHFEGVISQNTKNVAVVEIEADQKASRLMANLYKQLEQNGYEGHEASVFMMRILFCLFADDTRMWKSGLFGNYLKDTASDGKDTGSRVQALFEWLDTPIEKRPKVVDNLLQNFPYVNGGLFAERLNSFFFTPEMRKALIEACAYDWSSINPTIFGSLFQAIKSKEERREHGEHYTTEANIEKVLKPLFLNDLNQRIVDAWDNPAKLKSIKRELGSYKILDPACGSGNFLITAYKRLRSLELDIIQRIKQFEGTSQQVGLLDATLEIDVTLEQLHGIEHEEWSSQIANVALFLTDHQENLRLETVLGFAPDRFPLKHTAKIIHGNSLQIPWSEVCEMTDKTLIVGNPPFLGYSNQSSEQKDDQRKVWGDMKNSGILDYVSNWYLLAAQNLHRTNSKFAFVSTNSIFQGSQPSVWFPKILDLGMEIEFCYSTFVWESDASGKASVHTTIVGFSPKELIRKRTIYSHSKDQLQVTETDARFINGYLLDAPNILVSSRAKPLQSFVQIMDFGSKPTDEGFLSSISEDEAIRIRESDPVAAKYLRQIIGATELINAKKRYCLWLVDASPSDIRTSKVIQERSNGVREMRLSSTKASTKKDAETPTLFQEIRQPKSQYLALPAHSSENRDYIPMALMPPDVIASNALLTISNSTLSTFAILESKVFSLWNSTVSGRLKSDYRISAEITYNNFPFPKLNDDDAEKLNNGGQKIIDARNEFPEASLADLYDPKSMPISLRNAHDENDKIVVQIFGLKKSASDSEILKELFKRYAEISEELKIT